MQDTTPTDQPDGPLPQRRRPAWLFWLRALWLIALLPVIFATVAFVLMIDRQITAPSWLVARIEARADAVMEGGSLQFSRMTFHVGRDLHPTVQLEDLRLRDAAGALIGRVPQVTGGMSPRGLLFRRQILMQHIRLSGADIALARAEDGTLAVSFGPQTQVSGRAESLPDILRQLDAFFQRPALEALETVVAEGLAIDYRDARAGQQWQVRDGRIALDLRGGQTVLQGDFAILSGETAPTLLNLGYQRSQDSRAGAFTLRLDNVIAADLAAQTPALNWLANVDAPMAASLRSRFNPDGSLGPLDAVLEIGAGALRPNPASAPVRFTGAKTYLSYDPQRDRIQFRELTVDTAWGRLSATADAYLRDYRNGLPQALLAQVRLRNLAGDFGGLYPDGLSVPEADIDMRLRFAPFAVEIGQLVVNDGDLRLQASGAVTATDAGWRVALDAQVPRVDVATAFRFWPAGVKPRTQDWFRNNLTTGVISDLTAGLRIAPDRPLQFATTAGFSDATVRILGDLPLATGTGGTVSFAEGRLEVLIEEGRMDPPQGGGIDLAGSRFAIPQLPRKVPQAELTLQSQSSLTAVLSTLNQAPFSFLDKAGRPVTLFDGQAAATARITMPLQPVITRQDVAFTVAATVSDLRSDTLIPGRRFDARRMVVTSDGAGLRAEGAARVDGIPLRGVYRQPFATAANARSSVTASVALSPAFLEAFNIGLPRGTISGEGTGQLALELRAGRAPEFSLTSDLRGLRVAIAPVGWVKPANGEGFLRVAGTLGAVPDVTALELRGTGLRAEGRVSLTPQGQLDRATFSRFRVGDWLDAPVTLRGRGAGRAAAVSVGGGTLDLRRARFAPASGGGGGPVQVQLDRVQLSDGIALTGLRGDFDTAGGFSGDFTGQVNDAAAVAGRIARQNGGMAVRITAADAGAVARAAGLLRNARGGALDVRLVPVSGAQGSYDGSVAVRDVRLRDAPTMAALLDAISVVGLLQQLDGQGLLFDAVDARFRLTPERIIIAESSATGPGLGISLDGVYTLAAKRLDLQGVVSPFYFINSIGSFLTRRGEGLVGFNFNVRGTTDAPDVSVNPLSLLTPGMFRDLFRRPPPEVSQ